MSRQQEKLREQVLSVIELCQKAKDSGLDPFAVDADYVLSVIQEFYPKVRSLKDFCLDAEALKELSAIIEKQGNWIEKQSSSLYKDPFLLERRLKDSQTDRLAEVFLRSWHPIAALEQISIGSLRGSMDYWKDLLPLDVRWSKKGPEAVQTGRATLEDAFKLGLLSQQDFATELDSLWTDLKNRAGDSGRLVYWNFVGAETYEETVWRAFVTGFLVSYGYAYLEVDRLQEEIYVIPYKEQMKIEGTVSTMSVPVLVDYEEWKKWSEQKAQ